MLTRKYTDLIDEYKMKFQYEIKVARDLDELKKEGSKLYIKLESELESMNPNPDIFSVSDAMQAFQMFLDGHYEYISENI